MSAGHMQGMRSSLNGVQAHGYTLPRIVFWNLRGSDRGDGRKASVPVTKAVSPDLRHLCSMRIYTAAVSC